MTSNSSCSSAASAGAPPTGGGGAATATGAAAVTPNFSSKSLSSSAQLEHAHAGDAVEDLFLGGHDQLSSVGVSAASATGSVSAAAGAASSVVSRWSPAGASAGLGGLRLVASGSRRQAPRPLRWPRRRASAGCRAATLRRSARPARRRSCGGRPGADRRTAASARPCAPARRASELLAGSDSASALASAADSSLSPSTPPLTTRCSLVLAKSRRALATTTGSPSTKRDGRSGPVSSSSSSRPRSRAANRTRVFL